MTRRRILILSLLLAIVLALWLLPTALKAIPSRYVAAYLPQSLQPLAEREHVEILPTVVVETDAFTLLNNTSRTTDSNSTEDQVQVENTEMPPPVIIESPSELTTSETDLKTSEPVFKPTVTPTPLPTATPLSIPISSRLGAFEHHFQTWNNCGPATLAMGLSYYSVFVNQEITASFLKPNPEDRNVSPEEMAAYVNQETELQALSRTNGNLGLLRQLIAAGFPVIVELGLNPPGEYRWMGWYGHYLLTVAYDDSSEEIWVYDSWFGTSEVPGENADDQGRKVSYTELDDRWREFNRNYIVLYRPEDSPQLTGILGQNLDDEIMWNSALERVEEELQESPENAFLWFNLGTIYNALKEYEKAALAFDQARAIGLPWRMLWYQFGPYESYFQVGRYEDVILLAETTLQDRPYFEESYYYRGLAYDALGDFNRARTDFQKAVDFNPHYSLASQALAEYGEKSGSSGES